MSSQIKPKDFSREVEALAPLDDSHWQKQIALQIYQPDNQNSPYQNGTDSIKQIAGHNKTLVKGDNVAAEFGSLVIADDQATVTAGNGSRVRVNNASAEASSGSKVIASDGASVHAYAGSFVLGESGSTTTADGADVSLKSGGRAIAYADSHVVAEAGAQVMALSGSSVYLADGASAIVEKGAHVTGPGAKNALQMVGRVGQNAPIIVAPPGSNNIGVPFTDLLLPELSNQNGGGYEAYNDYQRAAGIETPYKPDDVRVIVASGAQFTAVNLLPVMTIAARGSNVTVAYPAGPGAVVAAPGSHVFVEKGGQAYTYAGSDVSGAGEQTRLQGTYLGPAKDRSMLGLKVESGKPYVMYQLDAGAKKVLPGDYSAPANSEIEAGAGTFIEAMNGSKIDATKGATISGFGGSEILAHEGSRAVLNPGAVALADAGSAVSVHLHGIAWAHAGAAVDAHSEWTGEEDALHIFTNNRVYRKATVFQMEEPMYGEMQQLHLAPAAKPGNFRELDNLVKAEDWREDITTKVNQVLKDKVSEDLFWIPPYEDLNGA